MRSFRRDGNLNKGFTLLEVMVALLIIGILLSVSLRFFTEQWRIGQTVKDRTEAQYAVMRAGRMVLDAIRGAESVEWISPGTLVVTKGDEIGEGTEKYYVADKALDGGFSFYWYRKGVHHPVVNGITQWSCTKGDSGLWTITLIGKVGKETVEWTGTVRQRAAQPMIGAMQPSLS